MDTKQLQALLDAGMALANQLSMREDRFVDASVVVGLIQATRTLRTRLEPPATTEPPTPAEAQP